MASGLIAHGTLAVLLTLLLVAVEVPPLHHHLSRELALYDAECPAMRLAAGAGGLGSGLQPESDLGAPLPTSERPLIPSSPGALGLVGGTTDARAPPPPA